MEATTQENKLYYEICVRQCREIELLDAQPSALGGSYKELNSAQRDYYLMYSENTAKRKKELRKLVGFWKYYFVYTFKFINNYNFHYY